MQCACAILSSVAYRFYKIFPLYLINGATFGKKLLNTKCVLIFSTNLFETFLITRRIERDMIKIYIDRHVQYPLFLLHFNETLMFSTNLQKILKWYDIYLLTASGLPPGGSCTIPIYTQTIHRTTQNKQYIEQHKIWEQYKKYGRVRAVPRLGQLYPVICLTTEEKVRKNLSQGSRTIRIRKPNNKST
jgi:hypothetical protein